VLCASASANTPPGTCNTFSPSQPVGLADPRVQAIYGTLANSFNLEGVAPITLADSRVDNTTEGVQTTVTWKTPYGTVTILPAVRESNENYVDAQGGVTTERSYDLQDSAEARFSSLTGSRLQYTVGAYYLNDYIHSPFNKNTPLAIGPNPETQVAHYRQTTTTEAAFGDATFSLVDNFRLIGGLRYTNDDKKYSAVADYVQAVPFFSETLEGDSKKAVFTYRAGFECNATPTSLVYSTVATGEPPEAFASRKAPIPTSRKSSSRIRSAPRIGSSTIGCR